MKYQSNYIKTITIDFSNDLVKSKTSLNPIQNLFTAEVPKRFSSGIINEKD